MDDEPNVLSAIKRQLRREFKHIDLAESGAEGLELVRTRGPYAVVVSDMRMPKMDGVQFLSRVKEICPESVRMMLTGNADQETAIKAVNQGRIFRFLNKPCPKDALKSSVEAALEQYRLVTAEKELLNKTLNGSIRVMAEILSQVNPVAFSRATQVKSYVTAIASELKLPSIWQYSIAGFLSQIGCVTVPNSILEKVYAGEKLTSQEQEIFSQHPLAAARILANIPRLENIAQMIALQNRSFSSYRKPETTGEKLVQLGGQILKIAVYFDHQLFMGEGARDVIEKMKKMPGEYNSKVVDILSGIDFMFDEQEVKKILLGQLAVGMTLSRDLKAKNGLLLASKGQKITLSLKERLINFSKTIGLEEPFEVLVTGGANA